MSGINVILTRFGDALGGDAPQGGGDPVFMPYRMRRG